MEEQIQEAVTGALLALGLPAERAGAGAFVVEQPTEMAHGDYATNAALAAAKQLGKRPQEVAELLVKELRASTVLGPTSIQSIEVAGPGFINITLSRAAVARAIDEAGAQGAACGKGNMQEGQRVVVEYTDPNPFKEMHIGHLMSNVIGESLARLIENEGAKVMRANYQGDVGPHVAKAIWGLLEGHKKDEGFPFGLDEHDNQEMSAIGEAYANGSRAYEEDINAKKEIDDINVKIYEAVKSSDGDLNRINRTDPVLKLYLWGRICSLKSFDEIYKKLGTHFDQYFFESETAESGTRRVRDGVAKGIFEESEGAIIYRGEKVGLHTLVFVTSRGTPTYEAKDIGLAFLKEERVPNDCSIIVTAAEQIGHFKVMLAALAELAPLIAAKTRHVPHGFLRFTSGKMSSREGNVITADALITEIIGKALVKNPDPLVAEQVAIGAIKYMILRQAPGSDIIFDPEKSLSLEGDSGPYLQYALVRAKKILAYAENGEGGTEEPSEPYAIERLTLHYPEVVARAARELAPNILTTYLTELAAAWNSFYASEQVLGSPEEAYKQRVAHAFANTMQNGLTLLGISAPEKM